jgi:hypothetical protein
MIHVVTVLREECHPDSTLRPIIIAMVVVVVDMLRLRIIINLADRRRPHNTDPGHRQIIAVAPIIIIARRYHHHHHSNEDASRETRARISAPGRLW